MSVFKCKMCGGTIEFEQGASVGVCDSCGTKQTLPKLDDDRRANLYDRANHFRRNNEFDKAMGIYETILNEDPSDAEAYWSLVLCRYGIEYVEDPATRKRVPTVNRAQYTSVLADEDYKSAIANADALQKTIYEEEAKAIDEIQKGILEISQKEEPFDVFICYKETGADGRRTVDSVRATELYHELVKEGFKVFFSRITLEDKLGTAYEPYIFAALNSAKVMVVLGTKAEHFNAVWVKNEWSRYLSLIKSGAKKTLIPAYQDMDPYDLPEEFSHLQAQDMSKLGFMQDLIRGIKKITAADEQKPVVKETVVVSNSAPAASVAPLLERVFLFLEDGKWNDANIYCEKVLDADPKNAEAYLGKLMAELQVRNRKQLADCAQPFDDRDNFGKVIRFGDETLENEVRGYIAHINERNETDRKQGIYDNAFAEMRKAKSEVEFKTAAGRFETIRGFKDADEKVDECLEKAEIARKDSVYDNAVAKISDRAVFTNEEAIKLFESIIDWKDSRTKIDECTAKIKDIKIAEEKAEAERKRRAEEARIAAEKAKARNKKIAMIGGPIAAVLLVFIIVLNTVIIPKQKLNKAMDLLNAGNYDEAYSQLEGIGESDTINGSKYDRAVELINKKDYNSALVLLKQITDYKDSNDKIESCYIGKYGEEKWNAFKALKAGDTYTFGAYEQDNNTKNGKEDIKWCVLAKEEGRILVISEYALDCQKYNTQYTDVTWETCSLRKWLNETFFKSAFSAEEQKMISETKVTADANPSYGTDPGNDTTDKVFLLSTTEAEKYFSSSEDRKCVPTAYAIEQGAYTSSSNTKGGKATCWWWLRSPGGSSRLAAIVYIGGSIYDYGSYVGDTYGCVRPALWIEF